MLVAAASCCWQRAGSYNPKIPGVLPGRSVGESGSGTGQCCDVVLLWKYYILNEKLFAMISQYSRVCYAVLRKPDDRHKRAHIMRV